jgi:hypothetical protein
MESGVEQAEQDFSAVVSLILTMAIFFCVSSFCCWELSSSSLVIVLAQSSLLRLF